MKFKTWSEDFEIDKPLLPNNRSDYAVESDEITLDKSPRMPPKNDDQDKVSALDSLIQHINVSVPNSKDDRVQEFKKRWKQLVADWENIKIKQKPFDSLDIFSLTAPKGSEVMNQTI